MMTSQAHEQPNEQLITRCETTRKGHWLGKLEVGKNGLVKVPRFRLRYLPVNTGAVCTIAPGPGQIHRTFRALVLKH